MSVLPRTDRPVAPEGYGYSQAPEGMLDWATVSDSLASAKVYWIGTARPDGSPHIHSIWGSFVNGTLYFEGGDTTRWAKNLAGDPRVAFGVESGDLHISGRGRAMHSHAGDDFTAVGDNYHSKYRYRPETDDFWRITPASIIALDMTSLEDFASSPTRFTFEDLS